MCTHRIQEEDGGFFEKLGTRLAERAQAQQLEESLTPPAEEEDEQQGAQPAEKPEEEEEEEEEKEKEEQEPAEDEETRRKKLCVAERREALYAAKESNLQAAGKLQPSDSESEEPETTALDILAQSVGLNVSMVDEEVGGWVAGCSRPCYVCARFPAVGLPS